MLPDEIPTELLALLLLSKVLRFPLETFNFLFADIVGTPPRGARAVGPVSGAPLPRVCPPWGWRCPNKGSASCMEQ